MGSNLGLHVTDIGIKLATSTDLQGNAGNGLEDEQICGGHNCEIPISLGSDKPQGPIAKPIVGNIFGSGKNKESVLGSNHINQTTIGPNLDNSCGLGINMQEG